LPRIVESIEINATTNRVWEVISDIDDEPKYWWGTREVRNISKEGNVVNREIYQNFGNHAILQKVTLKHPQEIEIQYLKGIMQGVKYLKINSIGNEKLELTADWNIRFTGIYRLISPTISGHVKKGTIDALSRIKDVSEGRPLVEREQVAKQTHR
jgi:hypothetical protein